MNVEEQTKDSWSEEGQVFFTGNFGYGITEQLQTICLGKGENIKHFFKTRELSNEFNPIQRQLLREIQVCRKEQLSGKPGDTTESTRKKQAIGTGGKRARLTANTKHQPLNLRRSPAGKRIPYHKVQHTG